MPSRFSRPSPPDPHLSASRWQIVFLALLWLAIYAFSLAKPALLDDADATHAQAAQAMLRSGDWVTLHVNGVRYLEKPPLPYWIAACSLRLFGQNSFAIHLPMALTVGGLAALGWMWGRRAFDERTGFYAALLTLTAAGTFLFTRIFIPDALLSLLLAVALYACLRALEPATRTASRWAFVAWAALAAAVLTKGFVALVFVFGSVGLYLSLSGEAREWRRLRPLPGACLLVAIAAPWHILAGIRNRGGADGHGFFWFYFVNEHALRFLGRRSPPDYNKLPGYLFWSLHLVWLFPWSVFIPVAVALAWPRRRRLLARSFRASASFAQRSALLLLLFTAFVLLFFSLSTNQEYYTFPVYLPVLLLTGAGLSRAEHDSSSGRGDPKLRRLLLRCHLALMLLGLLAAGALVYGLWSARGLPPASNVGDLLAHRGVGDYTLSMSHFFDLTGPSFSALRLPATLACVTLAAGPACAYFLRRRGLHLASVLAVACSSAFLLVAAHIALQRFGPMLSSEDFARRMQRLQSTGAVAGDTQILLFGDQALGSSIPFYLGRPVMLVEGRSTSMLFGSTFPDAPPLFVTKEQLLAGWGTGPRKLLFVPLEHRADVDRLLGPRQILVYESSGKALVTDLPLPASPAQGSFQAQRPTNAGSSS